ncbi:MAG: hypothetical protein P8Z76_12800 [Alphaproteobacteria bacterium]
MKFGRVPLEDADGAILVHTLKAGTATIRKGTRLGAREVSALQAGGFESVMVARLEPDDVDENAAASAIAAAATGAHVSHSNAANGRCNLIAETQGLVLLDRTRIDALNAIDEGVTIATIEPFGLVQPGDLIATIKIVSFAVERRTVDRCTTAASDPDPIVTVAAFTPKRVGLLQTVMPGARQSLVEKMSQASRERVESLGGTFVDAGTCDHDERAVAEALGSLAEQSCDIVLVLGASAIADRRDVVPAAVEDAGGRVLRFGTGLRLVVAAPVRRPSGRRRGHCAHGRGRFVEGDPRTADAAPHIGTAPKAGRYTQDRRSGSRRRTITPHGRAEQAAGRDRRGRHGAPGDRSGHRLEGRPGGGRDRA